MNADERYGHEPGCPHHPEVIRDGQLGECTCKPTKSRYGREPDKVKPLAEYLAEYVEPLDHSNSYIIGWRELLEQALDAYESTENVKIRIERV